ncbi:MAG: heavy metal-binding domain-containing protein [Candidatus Methanomethylophilus sp.]|nr:heavy metal-binding domain-containing protein [Methanomethylophilus sp.]
MLLTTTERIPGHEYELLNLVQGNMIQTKNLGKDIGQAFKSMVGGELKAYVEMVNQSRAIATKRMVEEAERLGADAIVMVRFTSSTVSAGAAEILVFGTAVKYTS